jgi:hypothetical protein
MALTATILQDAIVEVGSGKLGSFEKRLSNYGALEAFQDNAPKLLSPTTVEGIKKSIVHPVKATVLNKYAATVINAPSCAPTGTRPTSAFKSLTWAFLGFETKIIPSQNEGNYVKMAEDLALQLRMGWKAIFASLDTTAVSTLETNKNAVVATSNRPDIASSAAGYDYTGDPKEFYFNAPGLMMINDMEGPYNDVANSESMSTQLRIASFGANNQQNIDGVMRGKTGPWEHYLSNRVAPGSNRELHYLFPEGSIGIYNWVDPDSRAGRVAGNKTWDVFKDPMFGFDWSIYSVKDCVDDSAYMAGNTRAYGEIAQIGAWFAFLTEYSSDTSSPIIKVTFNDAP